MAGNGLGKANCVCMSMTSLSKAHNDHHWSFHSVAHRSTHSPFRTHSRAFACGERNGLSFSMWLQWSSVLQLCVEQSACGTSQ